MPRACNVAPQVSASLDPLRDAYGHEYALPLPTQGTLHVGVGWEGIANESALATAIAHGHLPAARALLARAGVARTDGAHGEAGQGDALSTALDVRAQLGTPCLQAAAHRGRPDGCRLLCEARAHVDARCLHIAARAPYSTTAAVVEVLVQHWQPTAPTATAERALQRASAGGADDERVTMLSAVLATAADRGHADVCTVLLRAGADVRARTGPKALTALELAQAHVAKLGHLDRGVNNGAYERTVRVLRAAGPPRASLLERLACCAALTPAARVGGSARRKDAGSVEARAAVELPTGGGDGGGGEAEHVEAPAPAPVASVTGEGGGGEAPPARRMLRRSSQATGDDSDSD
jgi:hypothetical protein